MEQFNLQTWIENKNRQIVTRDGRQVRIICWDAKNSKPIVALVLTRSISQRQFDELPISYFNDGTYYGGAKDDFLDLFFADEEKTNKILDELKSYLEKTPKEQVEKDWKEIQDWYAQHFTNEKRNEKEELTEFEKEFEMMMVSFSNGNLGSDVRKEMPKQKIHNYANRLLYLARKEIKGILTTDAYNQGREDALKDLPKWKKIPHSTPRKELFDMMHKHIVLAFNDCVDYYYLDESDLRKLPKEE